MAAISHLKTRCLSSISYRNKHTLFCALVQIHFYQHLVHRLFRIINSEQTTLQNKKTTSIP